MSLQLHSCSLYALRPTPPAPCSGSPTSLRSIAWACATAAHRYAHAHANLVLGYRSNPTSHRFGHGLINTSTRTRAGRTRKVMQVIRYSPGDWFSPTNHQGSESRLCLDVRESRLALPSQSPSLLGNGNWSPTPWEAWNRRSDLNR